MNTLTENSDGIMKHLCLSVAEVLNIRMNTVLLKGEIPCIYNFKI